MRASLFLLAAACGACGGKALARGELHREISTADGGVGSEGGTDANVADASDASLPPLAGLPWKQTATPLCPGSSLQASAHSVWSDGTIVYVVAGSADEATGGVFSNDGHGWVRANPSLHGDLLGITGFADGKLSISERDGGCGVEFVTGGTVSCSAPVFSVDQVAVVDASLAYAVSTAGVGQTEVIRYNGTYWVDAGISFDEGMLETPVSNTSIWAAPGLLALTSASGALHLFESSEDGTSAAALSEAVPAGAYTALWGSSADDLWAGTAAGDLLHRTGASWTLAAHADGCGGIKGIWGSGGTVYYITDSTFGQWSNGVATTPYRLPCEALKLAAIWGNSAAEVFITLSNPDLDATECGATHALWYNGIDFAAL